jgi:serine/threonine protein kinase
MIEKRGMIGTARYASLNAHLGKEQSRRDDLEALMYVIIYFVRGKLPWQNIYAENKEEKYEKIKIYKQNSAPENLCEGCPPEFVSIFRYIRSLEFCVEPDYQFIMNLFHKILKDRNLELSA